MKLTKTAGILAVGAALCGLVFTHSVAHAQCNIASTLVILGMTTNTVKKIFTMSEYCAMAAGPGNAVCNPFYTGKVVMSVTAMGKPSTITGLDQCIWDCGCGANIDIRNSDGLPLELMEFSVE